MPFSINSDGLDFIQKRSVHELDKPITGFEENLDATLEATLKNDLSISYQMTRDEIYDEQITELRKRGAEVQNPFHATEPIFDFPASDVDRQRALTEAKQKFNKAVTDFTSEPVGSVLLTTEQIEEETLRRSRVAREHAEDIQSRANGLGVLGSLAGSAAGVVRDPINIAAMLATAPIAVEGLLPFVVTEMLAAGISETVIQTQVRDFYVQQGMTIQEANDRAAQNVLFAVGGAGVLSTFLKGAGKGLGFVARKYLNRPTERARIIKALDAKKDELTPEQQDALTALKELDKVEREMPFKERSTETLAAHAEREQAALESLERGQIADVLKTDGPEPKPIEAQRITKLAEDLSRVVDDLNSREDSFGFPPVTPLRASELPADTKLPTKGQVAKGRKLGRVTDAHDFVDEAKPKAVDRKTVRRKVTQASKAADSEISKLDDAQKQTITQAETNADVVAAVDGIAAGDIQRFGRLMFELGYRGAKRSGVRFIRDGEEGFDAIGQVQGSPIVQDTGIAEYLRFTKDGIEQFDELGEPLGRNLTDETRLQRKPTEFEQITNTEAERLTAKADSDGQHDVIQGELQNKLDEVDGVPEGYKVTTDDGTELSVTELRKAIDDENEMIKLLETCLTK